MKTLLVANRGEIALRIMRTASALGIRTVAVHTANDRDGLHVRAADEVVEVPSYLDVDAIVAAAREVGADAIHPGYGFLSERSAFARAIEGAEGLVLVGPSADVMDKMGKKDAAREIAITAGVPVVPSYSTDADPSTYSYPVLVKAAAGGGGKGMRIVRSQGEYAAALAAAKREALTAFGDDTILIEKYVEHGRHIEVQVFADAHGNAVHLFERDCSTQRRHQKVLEEAPAPTITEAQREVITTSAVNLAREVGYTNAGTVEFLLDSDSGEVYFLEMNTRLQVEHPVTEEIVRVRGERIDLVELQLRIADGEELGFDQADVTLAGHAIEARVYAEDSFGGFLPQAGRADLVRWASSARVDHALESGQVVSTSFDPMLGKVIAWGEDREAARANLVAALDGSAVLGLTTNLGFVRALAASDEFRDATIDTAWLDTAEVPAPSPEIPLLLAAWVDAALHSPRFADNPGDPFTPDGWRSAGPTAPTLVALEHGGELHELRVDVAASAIVGSDGVRRSVRERRLADHVAVLTIDGLDELAIVNAQAHTIEVSRHGQRFVFERPDAFGDHGPALGDGTLVAPMPGTVLDVLVAVGQQVVEGETLGAMEAMKMELALKAPFAGTVTEVNVAAGQQVALGATLIVVEPVSAG
ncbi:carbamoyl-phosphate synthase L chain [Nocardioides sp. CF8]|uniref:ATP-binding protein n=1 Tax=Nocardioides sp. CF8 TaxID=110319 RepID=UPI000330CAF8|nr:biotin carboxylase N-terminal domain-containing protein [Nocardioides sp. CF8]EON25749.1 carbamoyl-phosphate synthase L chain [Nocardioides sp. CF8]